MMQTLRSSFIISDLLSNSIVNWISKHGDIVSSPAYAFSEEQLEKNLFIILRGTAKIVFEYGEKAVIGKNEHFGGMELMYDYRKKQQFLIGEELEAVSISVDILKNIPKILWRLLEIEEKRFQISIFTP